MSLYYVRRYDAVLIAYVVVGIVLASIYQIRFDAAYFFDYRVDLQYLTLVLLCFYTFLIFSAFLSRYRGEDTTLCGPNWRSRMRRDYLTLQHGIDFIRAMVILKLLLITYGCIKQAIPLINPRLYDEELAAFDIFLHAGIDPVRWTAHAFSAMGTFIDRSYFSWYYVKAGYVALFVLVRDRSLHHWYFKSFCLVWILGGLCAVLLPSLGPIYFHPQWFSDLDMPIARGLQEQLLHHYQAVVSQPNLPSVFAYEGIAAFPSLHVAIVALNTCFSFTLSRWLGWASVLYLVLIQLGSTALGWHYAVDGYFGIALAVLLFRCTRPAPLIST